MILLGCGCGLGSPPHARGKGASIRSIAAVLGITPACAGKSPDCRPRRRHVRDHPRMRGEKFCFWGRCRVVRGSPPHARGKDGQGGLVWADTRITPACAGKSGLTNVRTGRTRDHPRMRGEKAIIALICSFSQGSPPHARGKAIGLPISKLGRGITPACAGKRTFSGDGVRVSWDHPRMRGEKAYALP